MQGVPTVTVRPRRSINKWRELQFTDLTNAVKQKLSENRKLRNEMKDVVDMEKAVFSNYTPEEFLEYQNDEWPDTVEFRPRKKARFYPRADRRKTNQGVDVFARNVNNLREKLHNLNKRMYLNREFVLNTPKDWKVRHQGLFHKITSSVFPPSFPRTFMGRQ
jgi:hypothetical protein